MFYSILKNDLWNWKHFKSIAIALSCLCVTIILQLIAFVVVLTRYHDGHSTDTVTLIQGQFWTIQNPVQSHHQANVISRFFPRPIELSDMTTYLFVLFAHPIYAVQKKNSNVKTLNKFWYVIIFRGIYSPIELEIGSLISSQWRCVILITISNCSRIWFELDE